MEKYIWLYILYIDKVYEKKNTFPTNSGDQ